MVNRLLNFSVSGTFLIARTDATRVQFPITALCFGDDTYAGSVQFFTGGGASKLTTLIGTATQARVIYLPDAPGTLALSGSSTSTAYVAKTSGYTVTAADGTINCTSGTFTVTLLTAAGITGQIFTIKNSGSGTITLATTSSQTIDGVTTQTLGPGVSLTVQSNGANWILI